MKQEVVDYIAKCLTCQWVKMEHQRPVGLLQLLEVLEWKIGFIFQGFCGRLTTRTEKE